MRIQFNLGLRSGGSRWWYRAALPCVLLFTPCFAQAQFLRIGPTGWELTLNAGLTASTNVDGVSKEDSDEFGLDREDVYLTYGLSFNVSAAPFRDTQMSVGTSLSREVHFIRDDLDNPGSVPLFGDISFSQNFQRGRMTYSINASHSAQAERDKQEIFIVDRRTNVRDITETTSLGATMGYQANFFTSNAGYSFNRSTHIKEFEEGDSDSENYVWGSRYSLNRWISLNYNWSADRTELLNSEVPQFTDFDQTHLATVQFDVGLRPSLSYRTGLEREDEKGEEGDWEVVHQFQLSDSRQPAPNVNISASVIYNVEPQEEEDDITLTFSAGINHTIRKNWSHGVNAQREPVETFGSTTESESTSFTYNMSVSDFILKGMSANLYANWDETKPKGEVAGPKQQRTDYGFVMTKSVPIRIAPKLPTTFSYFYNYQIQDTGGDIEEHRGTLNMNYTF